MMKHKTAGGVSAWRELLLAALIGMAGAWSLLFLYFWMLFINQIHYLVENSPIPAEISAVTLALGALILPGAAWFSRDFFPKLRLLNRALFPLLLPVPALDGGRLVFIILEMLRGKPVDPEKEGMVHMAGMAALMTLMLFVLFNDIRNLM